MFNREQASSFHEKIQAFHVEWNVPEESIQDFRLGRQAFEEAGFGNLSMEVIPGKNTATISLTRKGDGEPAVYSVFLAAQATYARKRGLDIEERKLRLQEIAARLKTDEELRTRVMRRSLAQDAVYLETAAEAARLESEVLGITEKNSVKALIERKLSDLGIERP